jgi:hypothetical protein
MYSGEECALDQKYVEHLTNKVGCDLRYINSYIRKAGAHQKNGNVRKS